MTCKLYMGWIESACILARSKLSVIVLRKVVWGSVLFLTENSEGSEQTVQPGRRLCFRTRNPKRFIFCWLICLPTSYTTFVAASSEAHPGLSEIFKFLTHKSPVEGWSRLFFSYTVQDQMALFTEILLFKASAVYPDQTPDLFLPCWQRALVAGGVETSRRSIYFCHVDKEHWGREGCGLGIDKLKFDTWDVTKKEL